MLKVKITIKGWEEPLFAEVELKGFEEPLFLEKVGAFEKPLTLEVSFEGVSGQLSVQTQPLKR
jgi:hypothetical protein